MKAQKSQVKPPLVSIITATYNDETYIESSIRSVLSQDFTDFEYLIINDGSTDNTKKIVQRLQKEDDRIRLINQKNSGLVASLNHGITEARGTYIARIDGDDEWLPHKLRTQVAMLEANKNLVLVGGGAEIMNQDSVPTGFIFNVARNEDIRLGLCIFNQFCHSSVIYRRQVALDAGLYPDTCPAEDYDLFSKFAEHGELANVPYPIFRYRISDGSISARRRDEQNNLAKKFSHRNWDNIQPTVTSRADIKRAFAYYLKNPINHDFGISHKHAYTFVLMRIGYRMLQKGKISKGLHQLWNVASTGRTAAKIVVKWGLDIIKIKLRPSRRKAKTAV